MLRVIDSLVSFVHTVLHFLVNVLFEGVEAVVGVGELLTVVLAHVVELSFESFAELAQLVFEFSTESLQSVIHPFRLRLREITVRLDLPLNILELGLLLLLRLDSLHQHDLVVPVHLGQLLVHTSECLVVFLVLLVVLHVLLRQFHAHGLIFLHFNSIFI